MAKPKIFIGSSQDGLTVARSIQKWLGNSFDIKIWIEPDVIPIMTNIFDGLLEIFNEYDFFILALTNDDKLVSRDAEHNVPRDNVIFELGLALGVVGPKRTYAVYDETANLRILPDLAGIKLIPIKPHDEASFEKAAKTIKKAIRRHKTNFKAIVSSRTNGVADYAIEIERLTDSKEPYTLSLRKFCEGARKLNDQIVHHPDSVTPTLIVGINPAGAMIASYLEGYNEEGIMSPPTKRTIGVVRTGELEVDILGRRLFPQLPAPEVVLELSGTKKIGSVLVVDSEFKSGRSGRQIMKLVANRYREFGLVDDRIYYAVL